MTSPAGPLLLTVAIPTYNRADFLRQTLAGIALQVFPPGQFEVLVIDNNSTDHTRAVVAEFAAAHPAPRHVLETKQGLDHARNRAIAEARGEIIVFADDDILVGRLAERVRATIQSMLDRMVSSRSSVWFG